MTREDITPEQERSLHERWIAELEQEWAPLFESCPDPVYIYIDDEHKTCNQKTADFFGMTIEQFKSMESYLDQCVAEDSIDLVIHHYMQHFENECRPTAFEFLALKPDGEEVTTTAYNIPIVHDGQIMLLCFLRPHEDEHDHDHDHEHGHEHSH